MKVAIASDHAGFAGKQVVAAFLASKNAIETIDLGPSGTDSVDYPDFAHKVAQAVANGDAEFGVLVCGTGQGMAMAANRHPGIRAAVITDEFTAKMARAHNNANVACFGDRVVGTDNITPLLAAFLDTEFEGDRHARRVGKIER